ncbi:hypothetical protein [Microbacterium sp.]|uniref:hypothetical protein n=1 Tax=Microbacterium sp. TaxID=51671 RepID=UPI0039E4E09C
MHEDERYSEGAVSSFERYVAGNRNVFDRKTGEVMLISGLSHVTARMLNNGADREKWTWN